MVQEGEKKKKASREIKSLAQAEEGAKPGNELRFPQSGIGALTAQSSFPASHSQLLSINCITIDLIFCYFVHQNNFPVHTEISS